MVYTFYKRNDDFELGDELIKMKNKCDCFITNSIDRAERLLIISYSN